MSKVRILVALAAAAMLGGAVYPLLTRKGENVAAGAPAARPVVQVVPVEVQPMSRTVRLSGSLKSGSEATLSPRQGGKITAVYAVEGQAVRPGQPLVHLDNSDAQRQAEQAQAAVAAARANWEKALDGERLKRVDVERRISEARRGVDQARLQVEKAEAGVRLQTKAGQADVQRAQAAVDAARSTLAQAKKGTRPEQKRQLQIQLAQAERGVSLAKKNLDDLQTLYARGGVPRVELDQAKEAYQKAQDGCAQAKARLDMAEAGATAEEIAAAEAQVRSADAALQAARTAADRQELDDADIAAAKNQLKDAEAGLQSALAGRAEIDLAQKDTRAAKAALDQADAGARLARQQVTTTAVTSPLDGVVTEVNAHAGEMAGPGQPLLKVVSTTGVYLDAAAPVRLLADLRPGQSASIRTDSFPGQVFRGMVGAVSRLPGPDGRSYPVKINVLGAGGTLKPGGFARADVQVESHTAAVTAPLSAVRSEAGKPVVWVVRDRKIVQVPVETPVQTEERVMVRGDLRASDQVVVSAGPAVGPGDEVDAREGH